MNRRAPELPPENPPELPAEASRMRLIPLGIVSLVVATVASLFQNCGTYQPLTNPLYGEQLASVCLGPTCAKDLNFLNMYVGNADPILINNGDRAVDVGGYCDTAGFPDSKIYVEIKTGATSVVAPYASSAKCDANGRFRVLVDLPATYNYALAYSLVLTLKAVDTSGAEYNHPTNINRRELSLLTAP